MFESERFEQLVVESVVWAIAKILYAAFAGGVYVDQVLYLLPWELDGSPIPVEKNVEPDIEVSERRKTWLQDHRSNRAKTVPCLVVG